MWRVTHIFMSPCRVRTKSSKRQFRKNEKWKLVLNARWGIGFSFLLQSGKLPQNQQLNTHLLYHDLHGSEVQAWLSWVICLGSYQVSVRALISSEAQDTVPILLVIGRIQFLEPVELRPSASVSMPFRVGLLSPVTLFSM